MNKYTSLFIFLIINLSNLEALTLNTRSPLAHQAVALLEELPDYYDLVQQAESQGVITLEMRPFPHETYEAVWDSTSRVIRINEAKNKDLNTLICSILFELHNAKSDQRFQSLYISAMQGRISKEDYVEGVERMEHENALNCSRLLDKGVEIGIFSPKVAWPIYRDFDDYYKIQQIRDHSQWIARNYEAIAPHYRKNQPYRGTLPELSSAEKENVAKYLGIKNNLESSDEIKHLKGLTALQNELQTLENNWISKRRLEVLNVVFESNATYKELIKNLHLL